MSMVDLNTLSLGFFIHKMEEQCLWRLVRRVLEVGKGSHARGAVGGTVFLHLPSQRPRGKSGPSRWDSWGTQKALPQVTSPWIQHSRMSREGSSIEDQRVGSGKKRTS